MNYTEDQTLGILKKLERDFPSFVFDLQIEQSTRKHKLTVFNANRYSNTKEPQREIYYLEDFPSWEELFTNIRVDFNHEK